MIKRFLTQESTNWSLLEICTDRAWKGYDLLKGMKMEEEKSLTQPVLKQGPSDQKAGQLGVAQSKGGQGKPQIRPSSVKTKGPYNLKIYVLNLEISTYFQKQLD